MRLKYFTLMITLVCMVYTVNAQDPNDPEFRKGWELLLKVNSGMATNFKSTSADMFLGGIGLNPQFTVVDNKLRIGANAGMVLFNKKIDGLFGPMAAFKIKTIGTAVGSIANLHVLAEANWGTSQQQMAGGGIAAEVGHFLHIGITAQRDYHLNYWWYQTFIGIKLNKVKQQQDEYSR